MQTGGIVLKDGQDWVELRPLSDRWAEVVQGSLWARGDWVERPSWIDWSEAGEPTSAGQTLLPPWQMRLVYDVMDDSFLFPGEFRSPGTRRFRPPRRSAPPEDVEPFIWEIYVTMAAATA